MAFKFIWSRFLLLLVLPLLYLLAVSGCSSGGSDSSAGTSSGTSIASAGTATLRPGVTVVPSSQANFVAAETGNEWTLYSPMDVKVGDVLLLDDAAVRVLGVRDEAGKMVLTVELAEIEDVFSSLSLHQELNLDAAEFIPEAGNEDGALTVAAPPVAAAVSGSGGVGHSVKISQGPFEGTIGLKASVAFNFSYSEHNDQDLKASLNFSGKLPFSFQVSADNKFTPKEILLVQFRIPISYTVVDAALQVFGVRIASIQVPIYLGVEVSTPLKLGIQGDLTVTGSATYNKVNGLQVTPAMDAGASVDLPFPLPSIPLGSTDPNAATKYDITVKPYLRLSPGLVILNKVATIGIDLKPGISAAGQITFPDPPNYCLKLRGFFDGPISGYFI